jgi:hypothetical protein
VLKLKRELDLLAAEALNLLDQHVNLVHGRGRYQRESS